MIKKKRPERMADPGIVMIHVRRMCLPTSQRTRPMFWADPAPKSEDEMICVVLTGNPSTDEIEMIADEHTWALNP
jgi:hypothetical protein